MLLAQCTESAMSPSAERLLTACVFAAFAMAEPAAAAQRWEVDPHRTRIAFGIDSIGWPRTEGEFKQFSGRISIDFDKPQRSKAEFTVDTASLQAGSDALSSLIKSSAFLDAERHPRITFASTSVEKLNDRTARVEGMLTLLGVSKPVAIDVTVDRGTGKRLGFKAAWSIMRSQFGMSAGTPIVADKVDLLVTTEAAEKDGQ
jgi:polyisoprenoid-binding protein YceI